MRVLFTCHALLLLTLLGRGGAMAQSTVVFARDDNLINVGSPDTSIQPRTLQSMGAEARENVRVSGVGLKLHFVIPPQQPAVGWRLRVLDRNLTEVWSHSSDANSAASFWSPRINDDRVTVSFRADASPAPFVMKIDRVLRYTERATDLSIIGPPQLARLPQDDDVRQWSRGVTHITFVSDKDSQEYICTGFLISPDLLITNRHCIATPNEAHSAELLYDYDAEDSAGLRQSYPGQQLTIALSSCDLDFTLLRLSKPFAPADRRTLRLSTAPLQKQRLIVIQHAGGIQKRVSIQDCKVTDAAKSGNSTLNTDFGHTCDTLKSSSGSPVIMYEAATARGWVVGLHHLSAPKYLQGTGSPDEVNLAVSMKQIIDFIRRVNPNLLHGVEIQ